MKRFLATFLCLATVFSCSVSVNAEESQTIIQDEVAQDTQVTYTSAATYSITLPKNLGLSKNNPSVEYTVSTKGSTGGDDVLSIIPQDGDPNTDGINILLSDISATNRQPDILVNVTQAKTDFTSAEISTLVGGELTGTSTTGTLTLASTPKDGVSYTGILRFLVECTASSNTYSEKVQMFNSLKLYGAGDSVMEGYGNGYVGTLDYLEKMYGANILKDYSLSGATIKPVDGSAISPVSQQMGQLLGRMGFETPTNKTVIIWDGGGNDYMKAVKDAYSAGGDISVAASDSLQNNILPTIQQIYSAISGRYGEKGVDDFVMVYIIPSLKANVGNDGSTGFAWALKEAWSLVPDHVLVVDCNEILTADDYQSDGLHWNDAGYRKVSAKIADALYEHYN